MPEPEVFPDELDELLDQLAEASARLVRTVDAMPEEAWAGPSLLPGWSRGHLVAHIALNAEALAGVLQDVVHGVPPADQRPMYPSQLHRDADIAELAAEPPTALRERLLASGTVLADAFAAVPRERWSGTFRRTQGDAERPLALLPDMRLREVELHHVDLGLRATPADWPASFSARLVDAMAQRRPSPGPLRLRAVDLDRTWTTAPSAATTAPSAATTVHGTAADLGWWLTGRGTGEGLTTDDGSELPRIEGL